MQLARDRLLAAAPLLLIVLGLALHGSAIRGWWLTDDPQVLIQAIRESPSSVLFDGHAWRYLSSSSFTPLVTISFDADYTLFGVRPAAFYAHQIAAAIAAALLLFALLRRFAGPLAAFLAAAILLASPPVVLAVRSLMLRHYLEGLALSLGAMLLWTRVPSAGTARARVLSDGAASLLYLLAMLAKEFYAPLPLLMIAQARVAGATWRDIAKRALWLCAAAAIYVVWRGWILGSAGGYGDGSLAAIRLLPLNLVKSLFAVHGGAGSVSLPSIGLAAALGLAIAAFLRAPRAALCLAGSALVFLAIPLLAVAPEFDPRYALPSAAVLAAGAGLASGRRTGGALLLATLLAVMLWAGILEQRRLERETLQMRAEGEYVWDKPETAPMLLAWSPGWYLDGLEEVREAERGTEAPRYILSTTPIVLGEVPPSAVWTSHRGESRITPLEDDLLAAIAAERGKYSAEEPLSVRFTRRGNDLQWSVGPSPGRFTFLSWPSYDDFPMPPAGWRRLPEAREQQHFRVRRERPDGTWTLSPPLPLPRSGSEVRWQRTAG